jgi:hypothetical protein
VDTGRHTVAEGIYGPALSVGGGYFAQLSSLSGAGSRVTAEVAFRRRNGMVSVSERGEKVGPTVEDSSIAVIVASVRWWRLGRTWMGLPC